MYQDEYHPQIKKEIKKFASSLLETIKTHYIPRILEKPTQGEMLVGDLNGIYSYHFNFKKQTYRIA